MPSKYYAEIDRLLKDQALNDGIRRETEFDFQLLEPKSAFSKLFSGLVIKALPLGLRFARRFLPIFKLYGIHFLTRHEDVMAALENDQVFRVPFGPEMRAIGGGKTFLLGLDDEIHLQHREILKQIIDRENDPRRIAEFTQNVANHLMDNSGGKIDVMADVINRSVAECCADYFGIHIDNPEAFTDWCLGVSAMLFADFSGDKTRYRLGVIGARKMEGVIRKAIAWHQGEPGGPGVGTANPDTIIGRMIALRADNSSELLDDAHILATVMGLIVGFIPTTTLASSNILEVLLGKPKAMDAVISAASSGERDKLEKLLFEAARFKPAGTPGHIRVTNAEVEIGDSHWRKRTLKAGDTVMVATMSAMMDGRAVKDPYSFNPDRAEMDPVLMFGGGTHACMGSHVARRQITDLFMAIFSRPGIRSAHPGQKMRRTGPFPRHFDMVFDMQEGHADQHMLSIFVPLKMGTDIEPLQTKLADLQNPANEKIAGNLDAINIIHYASAHVLDESAKTGEPPYFFLELNTDGPPRAAITKACDAMGRDLISEIIAHAEDYEGGDLDGFLATRTLRPHTKPWGAIGVNFPGTGEFPVARIARDRQFIAAVKDEVEGYIAANITRDNHATETLQFARELARKNGFGGALYQPGKKLDLSDFRDISFNEAIGRYLKAPEQKKLLAKTALVWLALALMVAYFNFDAFKGGSIAISGLSLLVSLGISALVLIGAGAIAFVVFLLVLRRHEATDLVEDINPDVDHMEALERLENHPGFAQNHLTAIVHLKKGRFRKFTLALGLYIIRQEVTHWFRRGFSLDIGTIQYAKWVRFPGTDKFAFQANFDGSWESYLEDFSSKAHAGQTGAWTNGIGFPKTRDLINEGAKDADRFKRWVRRQQIPVPFWYSRFPDLTGKQIRRNALIVDGLARARTESEAKAWITLFDSAPATENDLQTDDIQTTLFRGMINHRYSSCLAIKLPDDCGCSHRWLEDMLRPVGKNTPKGAAKNQLSRVSFGEENHQGTVINLAFSAAGLETLGFPAKDTALGMSTFPAPFVIGMSQRGRILGDADPSSWAWRDRGSSAGGSGENAVADCIVLIYARNEAELAGEIARIKNTLGKKSVLQEIETSFDGPDTDSPQFHEPFGFRDSISQPLLRGSNKAARSSAENPVLNAGEFILGYRDGRDYFPPTPTVGAEQDPNKRLPVEPQFQPQYYVEFDDDQVPEKRDFGRNGSYLAVRQLRQDVEGFDKALMRYARQVRKDYPGLDLRLGLVSEKDSKPQREKIVADWIAAKLMGRWKNGSSMVLNPNQPDKHDRTDNQFMLGRDDPQGQACPYGAHIRRVNPRDSFEPGSTQQIEINNRHRLLRRGRKYTKGKEQGLLFMCFNANLERQFEFIQQTWISSKSFHGLKNQSDPIVSPQGEAQDFTIPTPMGPVIVKDIESYVSMQGGGYFFMPGRAALHYLKDLLQS